MKKPWNQFISKGNPKEITIPNMSLPQMFNKSVEKYANKIAITYEKELYTYKQLDRMVKNLAAALKEKGISKGDCVALMLPNCPQYPVSYFATLFCGAIVVQVNPMYQSDELLHVLQNAEVKCLIIWENLLPIVEKIKQHTSLTSVIKVSLTNDCTFNRFLVNKDLSVSSVPSVDIDPKEDIAVLQYTGGTTGRSKGAMLTHYNLVANTLQSYATAKNTYVLGEEKALTIAPLFHVYGMTSCMNLTFYIGGNMIIVPKFNIENTVQVIKKEKPTIFAGVPTMFIGLLNYYNHEYFDLSCLKTCSSGSAPLPIGVLEEFNKKSGTKIVEGYGLSEASPVTHRNPVDGIQKLGSVGIPVPNTDSKIVDIDTGEITLQHGEVGELVIKGPQVMKGYWKLPEETKNVIREGWLYTGDLAMMDEEGFFTIVGRKKELIIASGFNVYPVEIEDVLYEHPNIAEAVVIGVTDKYRGESIKAVVVLKKDQQLTKSDVIQFCQQRLAAYKVPRKVDFVETLPKSAVGKVLKRRLIEGYSSID